MYKIDVKEIVVVEGRDDTARLKKIEGIKTIETHGFGISEKTWNELEKAYREMGLIIFTDPDHAGEQIRKKLKKRFPLAKEAFIIREKAKKKKNIGIENATEKDIVEALEKAKCLWNAKGDEEIIEDREKFATDPLSKADIIELGLVGKSGSKDRRNFIADEFGFGYGNGKQILDKINMYKISKAEIIKKLEEGKDFNDGSRY